MGKLINLKECKLSVCDLSECVIEHDLTLSVIPKIKLLFLRNLKTYFHVS
jgi:hypothetical protein